MPITSNLTVQTLLRFLILWVGLLLPGPGFSAEIDATLSRNPVTIDESFRLIIETRGEPDGEPDFSPLEQEFEVINKSRSQNIQMINGNFSRTTSWTLTLMARQAGRFRIPEIRFGADSTRPLELQVLPADPARDGLTGDDLFIRVETDLERVYQGQQILLTLQLYRAVNSDNATLTSPQTNDPDIIVKKLGDDEQYETRIDDRRYLVTERRYALFPQMSGTLILDPFIFQGEIGRSDVGGRLFGSPFGGFGQSGRTRRIQSRPLQIEVIPPPDGLPQGPWLPSSNLQLVENWGRTDPTFRVGEPVTRTLMLFADGLTSAQLPELVTELPNGLKQYPDQPLLRDRESREGITGIHQMKIAIVPSRAGVYTLPEISVQWWNTLEDRMLTARIPEQTIQVSAVGADASTDVTAETRQSSPAPATVDPPEVVAAPEAPAAPTASFYLPGLTIVLGTGWLLTLVAWWGLGRRPPRPPATETAAVTRSDKPDTRAVRRACLADEPKAASRALLEWAGKRWPDSPSRSLGSLADRLGSSEVADEIESLERVLYAAERPGWQGAGLWQALDRAVKSHQRSRQEPDPIAPLHPE